MKQSDRVIAIVGPTASGKTSLSIELAKRLDGEIINGDAMQVYKGLDIGTAKIKENEKEGIPHHLFDIKEPTESFSVAEYQSTVRSCIEDIRNRGKQPIIVGGTGLYIQSILFDFRFTEEAGDEKIRAELEKELKQKADRKRLYSRLQKLDPSSAEKIHPNNYRRLIRALEIIEVTGKTKNEHEQGTGEIPMYDHLIVGLALEREVLYERINQRVDQMMEDGLIEEARGLWENGVRNVQSVQAIGYKELYQYFEDLMTLDDAIELIKKNTRHYAKRQMTYFRNKVKISWFDANADRGNIADEILSILKGFEEAESNK